MKKHLVALMTLMMGLTSAGTAHLMPVAVAADVPQIQWIDDVPINPKLKIEPGLGFAFESSEGRVVQVLLSGDVSASEMEAYYDQALEPLGWEKTGKMQWLHEGESLLISKAAAAGVQLWKITMRPE